MSDWTYRVVLDADSSAFYEALKKAKADLTKLKDNEIIVDLHYNNNVKELKKMFEWTMDNYSSIPVQFQYDINKKMLNEAKATVETSDMAKNLELGFNADNITGVRTQLYNELSLGKLDDLSFEDKISKFSSMLSAIELMKNNINSREGMELVTNGDVERLKSCVYTLADIYSISKNQISENPISLFNINDIEECRILIVEIESRMNELLNAGATSSGLDKLQEDLNIFYSTIQRISRDNTTSFVDIKSLSDAVRLVEQLNLDLEYSRNSRGYSYSYFDEWQNAEESLDRIQSQYSNLSLKSDLQSEEIASLVKNLDIAYQKVSSLNEKILSLGNGNVGNNFSGGGALGSGSLGAPGGTGGGENNPNVAVNVVPNINAADFVDQIQEILLTSGEYLWVPITEDPNSVKTMIDSLQETLLCETFKIPVMRDTSGTTSEDGVESKSFDFQNSIISIRDSLIKLREVLADVGDGEELSPLLSTIDSIKTAIRELSEITSGLNMNLNIDLGNQLDENNMVKLQERQNKVVKAYRAQFEEMQNIRARYTKQNLLNPTGRKSTGRIETQANQEIYRFNEKNYDTYEELVGQYEYMIDLMKKASIERYGKNIYKGMNPRFSRELGAAKGSITRLQNSIQEESTSKIENIFGNSTVDQNISASFNIDDLLPAVNKISDILSQITLNTGNDITSEVEQFKSLDSILESVIKKINAKTSAFEQEEYTVLSSVGQEINVLLELSNVLEKIALSISKIPDKKTIKVSEEKITSPSASSSSSSSASSSPSSSSSSSSSDEGKVTGEKQPQVSNTENSYKIKNVKNKGFSFLTGENKDKASSELAEYTESLMEAVKEDKGAFIKDLTNFYTSTDHLIKQQFKAVDALGGVSTYTSEISVDKETGEYNIWSSHIDKEFFDDQNKIAEADRAEKVNNLITDQLKVYEKILNIRKQINQLSLKDTLTSEETNRLAVLQKNLSIESASYDDLNKKMTEAEATKGEIRKRDSKKGRMDAKFSADQELYVNSLAVGDSNRISNFDKAIESAKVLASQTRNFSQEYIDALNQAVEAAENFRANGNITSSENIDTFNTYLGMLNELTSKTRVAQEKGNNNYVAWWRNALDAKDAEDEKSSNKTADAYAAENKKAFLERKDAQKYNAADQAIVQQTYYLEQIISLKKQILALTLEDAQGNAATIDSLTQEIGNLSAIYDAKDKIIRDNANKGQITQRDKDQKQLNDDYAAFEKEEIEKKRVEEVNEAISKQADIYGKIIELKKQLALTNNMNEASAIEVQQLRLEAELDKYNKIINDKGTKAEQKIRDNNVKAKNSEYDKFMQPIIKEGNAYADKNVEDEKNREIEERKLAYEKQMGARQTAADQAEYDRVLAISPILKDQLDYYKQILAIKLEIEKASRDTQSQNQLPALKGQLDTFQLLFDAVTQVINSDQRIRPSERQANMDAMSVMSQTSDKDAAKIEKEGNDRLIQQYINLNNRYKKSQSNIIKGVGTSFDTQIVSNYQAARQALKDILDTLVLSTKQQDKYNEAIVDEVQMTEELNALRGQINQKNNNAYLKGINETRDSLSKTITKAEDQATFTGKYTPEYIEKLNKAITQAKDTLKNNIPGVGGDKALQSEIDNLNQIMNAPKNNDTGKQYLQGTYLDLSKWKTRISKELYDNSGMSKGLKGKYESLSSYIDQMINSKDFKDSDVNAIKEQFLALQQEMYNTGQVGKSFGASLSKTFGYTTRSFITMYLGVRAWINYIRKAFSVVKEYDSALTNMSYTMNVSDSTLQSMGQSAIDMAKDLKVSISNMESIYKIYANMNTTAEEIATQAEPTAILSNLAGIDASTAADELQGVIQQFELTAEDSEHIVDVYDYISSQISMDYSKGINNIAEAVSAAGSVAYSAGLSFEQLAGIVAKTAETTRQDGSQIGNALKTNFYCLYVQKCA